MVDEKDAGKDDEKSIEGERSISPITENKKGARDADTKKKAGIAAGLVFLGILAFMQWPTNDPEPEEKVEERKTTLRSPGQFQPADLRDEPEVETEQTSPEKEAAPLGPIEKERMAERAQPEEQTEAELMFEASKRAPVMAFEGEKKRAQTIAESNADSGPIVGGSGQGVAKAGLAARLDTTAFQPSRASVIPHPHLTITQGTIIPCSLDTAMDSSQPGNVRCTVNDNIYSTTGAVVLLERGTRIVGQYQSGLKRGENRLFVIWTRAETPAGVIVTLDSPGTDSLGRSGFNGDIDTQFWTRFGATLMLSIIDDAVIAYANRGRYADNTESISAGVSNLATTELDSTVNIPIVLTKNQGEQVAVSVTRDLDFSDVYHLKAR